MTILTARQSYTSQKSLNPVQGLEAVTGLVCKANFGEERHSVTSPALKCIVRCHLERGLTVWDWDTQGGLKTKSNHGSGSLRAQCYSVWVGDGHKRWGEGKGLTWSPREVQTAGSSGGSEGHSDRRMWWLEIPTSQARNKSHLLRFCQKQSLETMADLVFGLLPGCTVLTTKRVRVQISEPQNHAKSTASSLPQKGELSGRTWKH
jgi:hypothetical protein